MKTTVTDNSNSLQPSEQSKLCLEGCELLTSVTDSDSQDSELKGFGEYISMASHRKD